MTFFARKLFLKYVVIFLIYTFSDTLFYFCSIIMTEGGVPCSIYFMLEINLSAKSFRFIKVEKYRNTVGNLLSDEIPEGYLVKDLFISESEGYKKYMPWTWCLKPGCP